MVASLHTVRSFKIPIDNSVPLQEGAEAGGPQTALPESPPVTSWPAMESTGGTKLESGADSITMVNFMAGAFISTAVFASS